jgi:hypothetical protein
VYLIMYGPMFIAAVRLRRTQPGHPRGYKVRRLGMLCFLGGASSLLAFVIGFVPPSQLGHQSPVVYGLLILAGLLVIGIIPPLALERFRRPAWKVDAG